MPGTLFIIATPIGNMEDITMRAVRVLAEVDLILTEDSRVTGKLLKHYNIENDILIYHQHSDAGRRIQILKLLIDGKDIALVTDAGTPGINDPGNELIDYILQKEPRIQIIPIPGASSLTVALSVSGFDTSNFVFIGFMPKKGRSKLFTQLKEWGKAFVFFESPHRIAKTLELLSIEFTDRRIFLGRELTKMYESQYRGYAEEVKNMLQKDMVKGEFVVVVEGKIAGAPTRNRTWN